MTSCQAAFDSALVRASPKLCPLSSPFMAALTRQAHPGCGDGQRPRCMVPEGVGSVRPLVSWRRWPAARAAVCLAGLAFPMPRPRGASTVLTLAIPARAAPRPCHLCPHQATSWEQLLMLENLTSLWLRQGELLCPWLTHTPLDARGLSHTHAHAVGRTGTLTHSCTRLSPCLLLTHGTAQSLQPCPAMV